MTSQHADSQSKRLAAIDIGSNSIRLLVAEAQPNGSYRVLDDEKQTTRLAAGLATTGLLDKSAIDQSLEALRRMKTIAEGYGAEQLQVIATSAVREAVNRESFLRLVRERLDLKIDVISALEEGELSLGSVARHFDLHATSALVVDLGGGSAELVTVVNGVIEEICSLPVGSVRLTELLLHTDPVSEADYRRLKRHVKKCFRKEVVNTEFRPPLMIGAGGTFTALAHMAMRRRGEEYSNVGGFELDRGEVLRVLNHLKDLSLRERQGVPGLNADRADIILAGLVVVERLMKFFHINRLRIHDQGVRDGLLLRMIEKAFHRKVSTVDEEAEPLSGIWQFAMACSSDRKHAEKVSQLALQLYDQLQPALQLDPAERSILEAAAILHEVGNLIHYEKHHHHSYHLILHGNIRGLSPKQRELVANVARYHRRSLPKLKHANFARLSAAEQQTVERLSAILRVADGLDRTHMQRIEKIHCLCKKGQATVTVTAPEMPDIDLWGAQQKGKFFEKVFGVQLKLCWKSAPHAKPNAGKAPKAVATGKNRS